MIVYNVQRRWSAKWADADTYRRAEGLPPPATLKVTVEHRNELVALLEALCSPPVPPNLSQGQRAAHAALSAGHASIEAASVPPAIPDELIDRAFVRPDTDIPACIPDFLLRAHGIERK